MSTISYIRRGTDTARALTDESATMKYKSPSAGRAHYQHKHVFSSPHSVYYDFVILCKLVLCVLQNLMSVGQTLGWRRMVQVDLSPVLLRRCSLVFLVRCRLLATGTFSSQNLPYLYFKWSPSSSRLWIGLCRFYR
jgi:hypothetical protein